MVITIMDALLISTNPEGNSRLYMRRLDLLFYRATSKKRQRSFDAKTRRRFAQELQNPRLQRISFYTFRHWKATMLYHETHDIVLVKEFLGHKTLDVTLLCIQIEKTLFRNEAENFIVKAAKETEEIQVLLEVGFEFVCQKDGLLFFRKRK
jgi:integrase